MACPFAIGSLVTWKDEAPKHWHLVWTPGPMKVVCAYYHDGRASEYLKIFDDRFAGGKSGRTAGWIIVVEYDLDTTGYYNPPLSLILGKKRITKDIHQMWLRPLHLQVIV